MATNLPQPGVKESRGALRELRQRRLSSRLLHFIPGSGVQLSKPKTSDKPAR